MAYGFLETLSTPGVRAAQAANGSFEMWEGFSGHRAFDRLTDAEADFVRARDSFYMATVSETGWPYVQHRGGPVGFLKVLDKTTLGFADFRGNRQYISLGNVASDDRVALFLMDYPNRARLKILAHMSVRDLASESELAERLSSPDYKGRPERCLDSEADREGDQACGAGASAARDTMLPKLMKSHYIALQGGKDPAIEVTEVGLAFLSAVRLVFPAYGDPVGRAMFEAELGEIGCAPTRAEAISRADTFRQRTRARVDDLVAAISGSVALNIAPGARAPLNGEPSRPPTAAMVAYAASISARKGLKLPRGLKSDSAVCRAFLSEHAKSQTPKKASAGPAGSSALGLRRTQR